MAQKHLEQWGTFHITSNAKNGVPWCLWPGVPGLLIDNLVMTRNLYGADLYAFCILPDHMHIILNPGPKGLSRFMHSFKRNSSKDICNILERSGSRTRASVNTTITRSRGSVTPAASEGFFSGWQNGFYDERILDDLQRSNALAYVQHNAYRHGLTDDPYGWLWSSVMFQDVLDPLEVWLH